MRMRVPLYHKQTRIKNGQFPLDGKTHQLSKNDFGNGLRHHLHGGERSYDRLNWTTELLEDGVVFSVVDPHGAEVGGEILLWFHLSSSCSDVERFSFLADICR